jgi:hypothetical protein
MRDPPLGMPFAARLEDTMTTDNESTTPRAATGDGKPVPPKGHSTGTLLAVAVAALLVGVAGTVYYTTLVNEAYRAAVLSGAATATSRPVPAVVHRPDGPLGDGIYGLGTDIHPGLWTTPGGASCYVGTLDAYGGTMRNDIGSGPRRFRVRPDADAVKFSGGCVWTKQVER